MSSADPPAQGNETERAATLPLQPRPIETDVTHTYANGIWVTGIMRSWKAGDSDRCRLCPRDRCTAAGRDRCLVAVDDFVSRESAALLSLVGCLWQDRPDMGADGHRGLNRS